MESHNILALAIMALALGQLVLLGLVIALARKL